MACTKMLFVVLVILSLDIMSSAGAEPMIIAQPSEIESGLTHSLDVNCTFTVNTSSDVAGIVSLTLSRANHSGMDFTDLGTINTFADHKVNILTAESVTATGHLNQTGNSFLQLHWDQPDDVQAGIYQCSVHGLTSIGNNVVFVNTTRVTPHQAILMDKITETDVLIENMAKHIDKLEGAVANITNAIEDGLSALGHQIIANVTIAAQEKESILGEKKSLMNLLLQSAFAGEFKFLTNYENSIYYISKVKFRNISQSSAICQFYGGYLAIINDSFELYALFDESKRAGYTNVYVNGRYDTITNRWVLTEKDQPLPYQQVRVPNMAERAGDCLTINGSNSVLIPSSCIGIGSPETAYVCEFQRPG